MPPPLRRPRTVARPRRRAPTVFARPTPPTRPRRSAARAWWRTPAGVPPPPSPAGPLTPVRLRQPPRTPWPAGARPPHPADAPPPLCHPRTAARPHRRAPTTFARRLAHTGAPPPTALDTAARQRPPLHPRGPCPGPLGTTPVVLGATPTDAAILSPSPARLGRPRRPDALPAPNTIGE
ncbi:lysine-rich arabinogalactan protein 19-like [Miscanthus floridulus]|uniref:lysine-rich arabinogalactan protein 19-like n=1 Tax=Miscanthus floridulus TaxID=154761 RepID=UPI00345A5C2F